MAVPIHGYVNVIYPDDAAKILEHDWHDVEGRTDISMPKIEKYASLMRQYKWTPDSVIRFFKFPDEDITWLCNGRHRIHAVLLSDTPQRFYCWVSNPPNKDVLPRWLQEEEIELYEACGSEHPIFKRHFWDLDHAPNILSDTFWWATEQGIG